MQKSAAQLGTRVGRLIFGDPAGIRTPDTLLHWYDFILALPTPRENDNVLTDFWFFRLLVLLQERIEPIRRVFPSLLPDVGINISGDLDGGMSKNLLGVLDVDPCVKQDRGERMPLRYNYDKPEKPRRIKGFEVFSLVFSSFSKPKNHTEISRIIGGVSLTTNE